MKLLDRLLNRGRAQTAFSRSKNQKISTATRDSTFGGFGVANAGGIQNLTTGLGTSLDKSEDSFFLPTRVSTRSELEVIYAQSWACAKFIDIPVDDMLIRWRTFVDMEELSVEKMEAAETKHRVKERLARAMKGGRLYGTAMMILMTREAPLEKPLNINRIREGDLENILVVDRFDCSVLMRNNDPFSQNFGEAELYQVNLKMGGTFQVHASRVLRFDGLRPISTTGWMNYEQDWGISEVIPVMTSIKQDSVLASGIAHLSQEASIPIMKIADFQDAVEGGCDSEMTLAQRGEATSLSKSIFRTIFMSKDDEFERQNVNFSQLPELMDRYAKRLAAAADIPATRFWGQSPVGMNATGESDLENYALAVGAMQVEKLTGPLTLLDAVLAKDAGVKEEITYEFLSLLDISEKEQADIAKVKMETAVLSTGGPVLTEEEAREMLDGDQVIGNLDVEAFETFKVEETPEGNDG